MVHQVVVKRMAVAASFIQSTGILASIGRPLTHRFRVELKSELDLCAANLNIMPETLFEPEFWKERQVQRRSLEMGYERKWRQIFDILGDGLRMVVHSPVPGSMLFPGRAARCLLSLMWKFAIHSGISCSVRSQTHAPPKCVGHAACLCFHCTPQCVTAASTSAHFVTLRFETQSSPT